MSLPGSPPGSGAPTPAALYRSAPDALHTSVSSTGTSSPGHANANSHPHPHPHPHPHSLSPSPRLTSSMLSAFLPGPGGALAGLGNGAAPAMSGGGGPGGALGPLGGLGSLNAAALTPGSPGVAQTSGGPGLCSECKLVEVHGVKVASFGVDGQELICLPQVFDLFLKHLVGGLHTVYTKLKRLDIAPVVCTVEQVRVLRGLGAIQPGVNRCKLISRKDFEVLYQDCTSASSRPGRPPKRCSGAGIQESPRLLHPGLLSPNLLSHTGLTAAAMAELQKLQKMKMMMSLQNGNESDNDDLHSNTGNTHRHTHTHNFLSSDFSL
ncbi:dachshund b [Gasterosteus aculeatus]